MPYLAVELDAKKKMHLVARACGVEVGAVAWGLLELWEHVWATENDVVTLVVLEGCVGPTPKMVEALRGFGFLEAVNDGAEYRVKGASRYLRVTDAKRRAGKTRATGARDSAGRLLGSSQHSSSTHPAQHQHTTSSQPALTPSTEHRAPNLKDGPSAVASAPQLVLAGEKTPKQRPPPRPPDPEAEFARFASVLTPDETRVFRAYEESMGVQLGADWGLRKFITGKLKAHHADELCAAIRGHAQDTFRREKMPSLRAILRDATVIASLAKQGAAS